MPNGQFPAIISLSDLDGSQGFKIDGVASGDYSGSSVGGIGDINENGIADFIIGAWGRNNSSGCSYVVFGGTSIGSSGLLHLSNLNGTNGFQLCGETKGDQSGTSVSGGLDINGDQTVDFCLSAPGYNSNTGRSYVIFGGKTIGSKGALPLDSLNGSQGFKIDGEETGSDSGFSLSSIGDINGDTIADLLIGADAYNNSAGRSYVLFGGQGIGSSGVFTLSSLNGQNGFKINGELNRDSSGWSVSGAGDINKDGIADLLIGAYGHNNNTGRSYLVFGGKNISDSGVLSLSALNGANGFVIDGETEQDRSGWSVSGIEDINGDGISDFVIGAWQHNQTGRSYVVFGGTKTGSSGQLLLSSLNGKTGFKLDGETAGDESGYAVSGAGDINGDGIADLLIGADGYNGAAGRTYVIFGNPTFNSIFPLSSLNGINGFKLEGEFSGDHSGGAVSGAGDVNDDGIDDLIIGAYRYNGNTGRSYVIFGDAPPQLLHNRLSLSAGDAIVMQSNDLSAIDRNHPTDSLLFISSAVQHGHFEAVGFPNISLFNFTQSQITEGQIRFVHDGSDIAPAYNISVRSPDISPRI